MYAVNISGEVAVFEIGPASPGQKPKKHRLQPGSFVELANGYLVRFRGSEHTEEMPSIVEKLTGGRVVPGFDVRAKEILKRAGVKVDEDEEKELIETKGKGKVSK